MRITDSVVIVTGASSGIGRATATALAGRGAHVVLVARGERALKEAARECEGAGAASTLVVPADVRDDDAMAEVVRRTLERYERVDAAVSNAGVVSYGRTEDVPAEVFDGVVRTNVLGAANLTRHVLPVLRRQRRGSLLYVGSVIGHVAVPSMTAYAVSKWGVRSLARQVRIENRDLPGLRIQYAAPGGVDTPIYQQAANYGGWEGRPPPPYSPPERLAEQLVRRLETGRGRAQLSPVNDVVRLGFALLPPVYDRIVGPACELLAVDLARPVAATAGNVLESHDDRNATSGGHGRVLRGLATNAASIARRLRGHHAPDAPDDPEDPA